MGGGREGYGEGRRGWQGRRGGLVGAAGERPAKGGGDGRGAVLARPAPVLRGGASVVRGPAFFFPQAALNPGWADGLSRCGGAKRGTVGSREARWLPPHCSPRRPAGRGGVWLASGGSARHVCKALLAGRSCNSPPSRNPLYSSCAASQRRKMLWQLTLSWPVGGGKRGLETLQGQQ